MSSQLVGYENAPNIYITKIILEDKTDKTFSVSVGLEMVDKTERGTYVWSSNDLFTPFLKVCLVHTTSPVLSEQITGAQLIPLPNNITTSDFYNSKTTSIKVYSIKEFSKTVDNNSLFFRKK